MEKSRLGITVNLVAVLCFLLALLGGYVIAPIALVFVLLFEDNKWLKRMALKAVLVMVAFSVISLAIDYLPNIIQFFVDIVRIGKIGAASSFTSTVNRIVTVLDDLVYIAKVTVFALLVIFAAFGKSFRVVGVDDICDKCLKD